jgi:DNA-binding transcriptional regulator YdaS (Cro superfamily)
MSNQKSIKAITRHMVMRVGGQKCAAKICGVSDNEVSLWCNDESTRYIPADHLEDLNTAAGDLYLIELARARGYELVPLDAKQSVALSIVGLIGKVSKATGEFEYTALEAAEDGRVTPAEARRIRDCIAPVKDLIALTENAIS